MPEDAAKVYLPIAERSKTPGTVDPILVAAVNAGAAAGVELSVLYMEGADTFVVDVDKGEVVELLQDKVAGVVEDVGPLVVGDGGQEALEGYAVVQIFSGMDFEAEVYALLFKLIENGQPAVA